MKLVLLLVQILLLSGFQPDSPVYWEFLTREEREKVLASEQVNPIVSDYYLERFAASDDALTERLLDVLTTKQKDKYLRALHFYLFNKVLVSSDGAVAEMLRPYTIKMVCEEPEFILTYLGENKSLEEVFVQSIGTEIYLSQVSTPDGQLSLDTLKRSILKKYTNKELIAPFFQQIEAFILQLKN